MATRPRTFRQLATAGVDKARRLYDVRRGSAAARGYGRRWRKLREMVLNEEPICRTPRCGQPASEVDHIVPKSQGGTDARENLQSLCKRCHSTKTATHDGGFGRGGEGDFV